MCYHTSQKTTGSQIAKALQAPFPRQDDFKPIYHANGFAHPDLPVLSMDGGRSIQLMNWGLIPFWVKDWTAASKLRNQTLNARSEDVFEKASFRDAIKSRRCIIPVTGFYEWKHVGAGGKDKIPYFIHPKEHPLFYLAGIYSKWTEPLTKAQMITYSVLTGEAGVFMADIHNSAKRQPIRIDEHKINAWIDPGLPKGGIVELMQPCDDSHMAAYTVSRDLSNPKINSDTPEILNPVDYGAI
jgi:putative SOS response-associated peptidase YedK